MYSKEPKKFCILLAVEGSSEAYKILLNQPEAAKPDKLDE